MGGTGAGWCERAHHAALACPLCPVHGCSLEAVLASVLLMPTPLPSLPCLPQAGNAANYTARGRAYNPMSGEESSAAASIMLIVKQHCTAHSAVASYLPTCSPLPLTPPHLVSPCSARRLPWRHRQRRLPVPHVRRHGGAVVRVTGPRVPLLGPVAGQRLVRLGGVGGCHMCRPAQRAQSRVVVSFSRPSSPPQVRYMLGDAGRSLLVGYGRNPPKRTQDRGAACPDAPEVGCLLTGAAAESKSASACPCTLCRLSNLLAPTSIP